METFVFLQYNPTVSELGDSAAAKLTHGILM